jgi:hypothetical protein
VGHGATRISNNVPEYINWQEKKTLAIASFKFLTLIFSVLLCPTQPSVFDTSNRPVATLSTFIADKIELQQKRSSFPGEAKRREPSQRVGSVRPPCRVPPEDITRIVEKMLKKCKQEMCRCSWLTKSGYLVVNWRPNYGFRHASTLAKYRVSQKSLDGFEKSYLGNP